MKTIFKLVICTFIVCVALSSCASTQSNKAHVIIEDNSSSRFRISNVLVTTVDSMVTVTGILHSQTRSRFSGHVDITFLSASGEVLHTVRSEYRRKSFKSRNRMFRVNLPLALPDGSAVHIVHQKSAHNGNG